VIGPESGRITVTGNNFSDSFIGRGAVKREGDDGGAGGLILEGTSDIAISGNVFSGVGPRAVAAKGEPSRRVLFADNVLTDVTSEHSRLRDSVDSPNVERAVEMKRVSVFHVRAVGSGSVSNRTE